MFIKAQIKLTFFYSMLFLLLFWSFSFGIYTWMNNSFGEGYISQVIQRQNVDTDNPGANTKIVSIAGDVALEQLLQTLLILNSLLIIIIPTVSWFLAKRTLKPIVKMHEQQKQFVSDASHELRTPLSIISSEIEISLNKKRKTKDYEDVLRSTKEETNRLSKLVENLLFLANADRNTTLRFEQVDLTDIISEVVNSLKPKSSDKHIKIKLVTSNASAPIVSGHPTLLHQLFYNLIDNAITFTPRAGKITISVSNYKDLAHITIADTGIGINKENLGKITDRFYREDESRSKTKGYGLGLSIAKTIIDRHRGKLIIDSKINKGTTLTVSLPKN